MSRILLGTGSLVIFVEIERVVRLLEAPSS